MCMCVCLSSLEQIEQRPCAQVLVQVCVLIRGTAGGGESADDEDINDADRRDRQRTHMLYLLW